MTVDFSFKRAPSYRVATLSRKGGWDEKKLRGQFKALVEWAKKNHLRMGRWLFFEPDGKTFIAAIEVKGKATGSGRIRLRTIPSATVASVTFNSDDVSPRVIYHGLNDWLRWRKKDKEIKKALSYREVYSGDPWSGPKVWAHTEIQVVVKK
ncbi:MAG: GyrI-like domain-containing protein [Thermoplasmata archaeon]